MSMHAAALEDAPLPPVSQIPRDAIPGGRLIQPGLNDEERGLSIAIHLTPVLFIVLGPIAVLVPVLLWGIGRRKSAFVDDHGLEFMNFGVSFLLLNLALGLTVVGIILLPALWIVGLIGMTRGAIAAGRNEYFRYPLTFRFLG